jgi:hypothetical protein
MASNGVIGITAQIMESSEITGTGAKKPTDPSMSIFQRISMGLKNIKKNFNPLVYFSCYWEVHKSPEVFWVKLER